MRLRTTLFMILCTLASMVASAQTNVGYCNGEYSKKGTFSVDGNRDVSAAIFLTPSFLAPYDGCEVTALRVALASKINIDRVTLWLRRALDGENLVQTEITSFTEPALAKGWIETALGETCNIDSSTGLYLGMTYHQKGTTKALSLTGSGFENSFYADLGDEAGWKDLHEEGILSIEMTVSGNVAIDYDLALLDAYADMNGDVDNNIVTVRVANSGKMDVAGFTLGASYSGDETEVFDFHFTDPLPRGEKADVVFMVPKRGDLLGNPMTVRLLTIDGGEDAVADNNEVRVAAAAMKKVFVEEYTAESCGNCPRVARYLHEVMEEEAYAGKVVAVCHRAGYDTDWLTQPCDEDYAKFFRVGFAPAVAYDRYPHFNGSTVHCPDKSDLRNMFDKSLAKEPGVKISISPDYQAESGKLGVTVNLERINISAADPRLTVYVTEDNIKPRRQSGNSDGSHMHNHVIRAYNSTWGDPVAWEGTRFTATYDFKIDPEWDTKEIRVIAVVANRNAEDNTDNVVVNADEARIVSTGSSVDRIEDSLHEVSTVYHDLLGRRVDSSAKGIVVKTSVMSDGSVRSAKIINRH